jgi:nicotinamidase-related amidase
MTKNFLSELSRGHIIVLIDTMTTAPPQKIVVICDLQQVALNSLPETPRRALVDLIRMVVHVARRQQQQIVWSGLCFSSDYQELTETHKVFGVLRRIHRLTQGNSGNKFFVKDEDATKFVLDVDEEHDKVLWRSGMQPPSKDEWYSCIDNDQRPEATVVGIRTGYAIQSTVQMLCDFGWKVSVVDECILDDDQERHTAIMKHLLPLYGDVVTLADWVEANGDSDSLTEIPLDPSLRYLCDCGRGGHSFLYQQHLLLYRKDWARCPLQPWYVDKFSGKSYTCPLGKRVIDFCDEPRFSRCSMYIKGREWLDEKDKLWELAKDLMPRTYLIEKGKWVNDEEVVGDEHGKTAGPFFLKECMKNGGKAVQTVDSLAAAFNMADPNSKFVVQQHVAKPMLTTQGQKCHIKAYFLLTEDNGTWELRVYPEAFLSISPNPWSPTDLSFETQVTVKRTKRLYKDVPCELWPSGWPSSYTAMTKLVCEVVHRAFDQGKLQSRGPEKRQFEIFSADVMIDAASQPWLIECNFGCVMFDPKIGQPLTTIGLRTYQALYESQGDACEVNDHKMIADTVSIAFDKASSAAYKAIKWELIGSYSLNET